MHSMIEQIREVEDQAIVIRQEAVLQGKELVAAAQMQAKEQAQTEAEAERIVLREAMQKAENTGRAQAEKIIEERAGEADTACKLAEEKQEQAVAYLLEKVVNNA